MVIKFLKDHLDFTEGQEVDFAENLHQAHYFITMGVAEEVKEPAKEEVKSKKSK